MLFRSLVALRKLTLGSPIQADLPSNVTRVRIAAELNLESFHPAWEIGYAALEKMQGADYFAKREAGYIDTVNGRQVVWTPNEMYLIPLQDNVLSIVRPADRRFVGQWLKKDRSNVVSSYLQQVAARNFDSKSVLIAVDVEDVLSPQIIQERLQGVKSIAGKNLAALSTNLGDLQGVTIEVANESLQATITVDFRNPVAELAPVAKEFFGEVLAARGVQLAGYSNWQVGSANDGKSLRFTGPIATETLDDLLGMFTVHRGSKSVASNEPTPPASTPETSQSVIGENTRDYFKKIINIVHRVRDYSASNTGERAQIGRAHV